MQTRAIRNQIRDIQAAAKLEVAKELGFQIGYNYLLNCELTSITVWCLTDPDVGDSSGEAAGISTREESKTFRIPRQLSEELVQFPPTTGISPNFDYVVTSDGRIWKVNVYRAEDWCESGFALDCIWTQAAAMGVK
jgi:hypothetical protein